MTTLHVRISNQRQFFCPGDTIIGEVILTSPLSQADIQSIGITLKGKAKAQYRRSNGNNSTTYRSKVTIFKLVQTLFQGPFTLPPGNKSWPFEFVIPTDCRWSSGDKFESVPNFDSSNQQGLPPTYSGDGRHKECQIEYALEATMNTNKTFKFNKETLVPIRIMPQRTLETTNFNRVIVPHLFACQSLHLDPEIQNRSLTLKEKMRSTFKTETLPKVTFTIKTDFPEAAMVHESINPVMYLEHDLQKSTAGAVLPEVKLISFQMALKADVFILTAGSWSGYQVNDFTERHMLGSWAGCTTLPERFEPAKLFRNGLVVKPQGLTQLPPTFQTFNVAVLYRWKINYTIEVLKKTMDAEHSRGCIILSSERATVVQEGQQALPPVINAEEPLPVYTKEGEALAVGV